ncbi:hypothetical protein C8A00DRAFT_19640 [Chaetomidium leptoderma]|uniref:Uncharacterized protein n=1 Tax=Chaetomidium leptoderma TaxID=669021 RepID=A0AAN6VEA8_9PEZI|nr:hypothetical protein C8A00DRAFT_19640 [Chaetomidium leptoderma]
MPYHRLTSSHHKLRCVHGRQRYEAAIRSAKLGPDTWWTVKLYCLPQGIDPRVLLRNEVEQDHHQTKYNDGHVFCAVLYWEEQGDPHRAHSWRSKLTLGQQKRLDILMKWKPVKERLMSLRAFPGLLDALKLGNVERMVHSRGLPQIIRNLDHIYNTWDMITLGESRVRRAADVPTVQHLQMLAPSASRADRSTIRDLMQSGELFHTVRDPGLRARIEQRILQTKVLIPSVRSFHENMKYLQIVNHIMESYLITTLRRGEAISEALDALWSQPEDCLIEYTEGQFTRAPRPPSLDLSFMTVVVAALRGFPRLCDGDYRGPRCEVGERHTAASKDEIAIDRFRALARKVGYRVATAQEVPLILADMGECAIEPAEGPVGRRWNRPFSDSARFCASKLFLPELLEDKPMTAYPGTLFVQRDFIRSFFGEIPDLGPLAQLPPGLPELQVQPSPPDLPQPASARASASSRLGISPSDSGLPSLENPRRHGWGPADFTGFTWPADQESETPSLPRRLSIFSEVPDRPRSGQSNQLVPEGSRPPSARWTSGDDWLPNSHVGWNSRSNTAQSMSRSSMNSRPSNYPL